MGETEGLSVKGTLDMSWPDIWRGLAKRAVATPSKLLGIRGCVLAAVTVMQANNLLGDSGGWIWAASCLGIVLGKDFIVALSGLRK